MNQPRTAQDALIQRLREGIDPHDPVDLIIVEMDMEAAAAEIERLRAENEQLRQEHTEILTCMKEVQRILPSIFTDKARAILAKTAKANAAVRPADHDAASTEDNRGLP